MEFDNGESLLVLEKWFRKSYCYCDIYFSVMTILLCDFYIEFVIGF